MLIIRHFLPIASGAARIMVLSLFVTASTHAQDRILLKNGDTLSGEIIEHANGQVHLKSKVIGSIQVSTNDIEQIQTGVEPGTMVPRAEISQSEFVGPLPPSDAIESKWSGQAGLSIAMRESIKSDSSGVTSTDKSDTFRFYGDMGWKSGSNRLRWNWSYRYSRDEYAKQDDYFNLTQHYTHDFRENYYATAKTMYQRDYRRKIRSEYLQTAEMGIKWATHPAFEFSTSAGAGYHHFERTGFDTAAMQEETKSMGRPRFIFDESLRWQIINSLTLLQKYTHLGDLSDYHFVFTTGLENKLIHDIFLRLEYRLDRDTEVEYDDRGYYDKALLTSVLYKF